VDGGTRLDRLYQCGAAKVRLPNVAPGAPPQAVLINTAGGLTGGDRLSVAVALAAETRASVTTQACEKVYRSAGGLARVATRLQVGPGARLDWLPQETILFDGAGLERALEVELADGATLLACEAVLFGRKASGETIRSGLLAERWRVRRGGRVVFADDLRFDWAANADLLARPAVLDGATAIATVLLIGPHPEAHLDRVRAIVGDCGGASVWGGKLLARITGASGAALRRALVPVLQELSGGALPRIWQT